MSQKIVYELTEEEFQSAIRKTLSEIQQDQFLSRYSHIIVSSQTACEILNISRSTLHRYMDAGILQPEEKAPKEAIRFRLSYLLSIDIKKLKTAYRYDLPASDIKFSNQ